MYKACDHFSYHGLGNEFSIGTQNISKGLNTDLGNIFDDCHKNLNRAATKLNELMLEREFYTNTTIT